MNYYLVVNLKKFSEYDYKGLDINSFVAGSQVYNDVDNEFAVASTEEIDGEYPEVTKLSESDYEAYREEFSQKPVTEIELQEQIKELEYKLDEKDRENKTALFEIYNMLLGGE